MSWEFVLSAVVTTFIVAFTPGPNNIICTAIGVSHGFRRALPYAFGVTVGFPLLLVVIGAGLGGFIKAYPDVQVALKVLGGAFLIYLSYQIAAAKPQDMENEDAMSETAGKSIPGFFQAIFFQWINPKAVSFAFSLVSVFLRPQNIATDLTVLAVITAIMSLGSTVSWAFAGTVIRHALKTPRRQRLFNRILGILLFITALFILFL